MILSEQEHIFAKKDAITFTVKEGFDLSCSLILQTLR